MHQWMGVLGRVVLAAWLLFPASASLPAQESSAPPARQQNETFAGHVTALASDKLTVTRSILGRVEKRTFLIKPDTRIEGKLRVKSKVTVGFVNSEEGDVARLIVVRNPARK